MDREELPSARREPAGTIRTTDVLGALSAASDLALGMPEGHAARSCYLGMVLADRLHLSPEENTNVYYSELLMDAGCTSWAGYVATAFHRLPNWNTVRYYFNQWTFDGTIIRLNCTARACA